MFSFGIVLCELIALIDADPDFLPRTENFGVDYIAFTDLVKEDCPTEFLKVAFSCVQVYIHAYKLFGTCNMSYGGVRRSDWLHQRPVKVIASVH